MPQEVEAQEWVDASPNTSTSTFGWKQQDQQSLYFWALVNLVIENNSKDVMKPAHDICLKDLTILAHSAIPTL